MLTAAASGGSLEGSAELVRWVEGAESDCGGDIIGGMPYGGAQKPPKPGYSIIDC